MKAASGARTRVVAIADARNVDDVGGAAGGWGQAESLASRAAGASELRVALAQGDILVRAGHVGEDWRLDCGRGGETPELLEVERDGPTLRISGGAGGGVRLTVPPDVRFAAVDLSTGSGAIEAGGGTERSRLRSNNGPLRLRAAGGDADLLTRSGDVAVEGEARAVSAETGHGSIKVERARAGARLTSGSGAVALHADGGEVQITTRHGDVTVTGEPDEVEVRSGAGAIRVARARRSARLSSGAGAVEVAGCDGVVRIDTGQGDVVVADTAGELDCQTGHGKVTIRGPRALAARVQTGAGAVEIAGGTLAALRLTTGHGNVRCAAALQAGEYRLETSAGSVEVALAAGIRARVELQTGAGKVESDFPLVQVGRSGPMGVGGVRMVGSLGQGEAEVTLSVRSGFGNLALRRMPLGPQERGAPAAGFADPGAAGSAAARPEHQPAPAATGADDSAAGAAPAAAPVDPPASDDPASRRDLLLALLEAVARGELTPDEAAPYVARYLD